METQLKPKENVVESEFQAGLMNLDVLIRLSPYYPTQEEHMLAKQAIAQIAKALSIAYSKEQAEKSKSKEDELVKEVSPSPEVV